MRICILLAFYLFCNTVSAQIDSTYIGFYPQKISIKGYIGYDFLYMVHEQKGLDDVEYLPNTPPHVGGGISINNTVISFSYGYGFQFLREKNKGKTKAFDFQIHNYGRKFAFDLFAQEYDGFYIGNDDEDDKNIVLAPDLRIYQYGVHGQYVFNHKRFSYMAAFDQNEKQLKSAGSILAGIGAYRTKIASDSSFIHNDKNVLRNFQFGISGGYTYTWVISPQWYINGSIVVGINFGNEKMNKFGKGKIEVYPTVFPRISAGYSKEDWSIGFAYVSNILYPSVSPSNTVALFSGNLKFTYTYRIQSVPILSKFFQETPISRN